MYSLDFRKHVLKIGEAEGLSIRKLAKRFGIGFRTLVNWRKNLEPVLKRNRSALRVDREALARDVEQHPDAYLYERAQRFQVSANAISNALKRLGVTYKKKPASSSSGSRKKGYFLPKD